MTPLKVWKNNKWRYDLRKYTREFEKKFKVKKGKSLTEAGKIYAIKYRVSSDYPTDKHHVTPLIVSFGRFRDENGNSYIRALNLFFLSTSQVLEVLEDLYLYSNFTHDERAFHVIKLHEKYIKIYPYIFKNFEEKRVLMQCEVSVEEWGMIPLLQKNLWGIFNPTALDEDFQRENKKVFKKVKKKPQALQEREEEYEEYLLDDEIEDDLIVDDTDLL